MEKEPQTIIRIVYLYLATFIGLIIMVVGIMNLVDFVLGYAIPDQQPTADQYQYFGQLRNGIASIVVGLPLWWYHWRIIQRDRCCGAETIIKDLENK